MCTSTVAGGHTPTRMATQTAVTATISCYYCSGHFYNCDIIGRMVTHTMSQPTRATPVLHTPSTVASRSHTLLQSIPHRVAAQQLNHIKNHSQEAKPHLEKLRSVNMVPNQIKVTQPVFLQVTFLVQTYIVNIIYLP